MRHELRHVRAFLKVAELQSFTRAAAELHVSQSALTVQVKQLEEELGVLLFDRNKRGEDLWSEDLWSDEDLWSGRCEKIDSLAFSQFYF